MDYWKECISEAFEDAEIIATDEQLEAIVSWVEGAHENYGMATGEDCIPNPLVEENNKLSAELQKERDKVICGECNGDGSLYSNGPCHSSMSQCWKCRGEGMHAP